MEENVEKVDSNWSLVKSRAARSTAGRKMQLVMQDEQEDEFYKELYGGFQEEVNDEEYLTEDEEEDVVDSDFDIDENEEEAPQDDTAEAAEDGSQRKRKLAYDFTAKRPAKRRAVGRTRGHKQQEETQPETEEERRKKEQLAAERRARRAAEAEALGVRKSQRASAIEREVEYQRRAELREAKRKRHRRTESFVPKLTQEELLKEAEQTAILNVADLDRYLRMEDERKKARNERPRYVGPAVTYLSTTRYEGGVGSPRRTPASPKLKAREQGEASTAEQPTEPAQKSPAQKNAADRVGRNFVIFPSEDHVPPLFSGTPPTAKKAPLCTITGLVAKYRDPLTQRPFATIDAFKMIRAE